MRVLLFVQNKGDKRPVCVSRSIGHDPAEMLHGQRWLGNTGFYAWWTAADKWLAADRWWLVECESAEAGRHVIYHFDRDCVEFPKEAFTRPFRYAKGVVLSYGGKR